MSLSLHAMNFNYVVVDLIPVHLQYSTFSSLRADFRFYCKMNISWIILSLFSLAMRFISDLFKNILLFYISGGIIIFQPTQELNLFSGRVSWSKTFQSALLTLTIFFPELISRSTSASLLKFKKSMLDSQFIKLKSYSKHLEHLWKWCRHRFSVSFNFKHKFLHAICRLRLEIAEASTEHLVVPCNEV